MPTKKKTSPPARKARRTRIAAGLVAGKTLADLAKADGISRETASREANTPETRILIASLLDRHHAQAVSLVAQALNVAEASLGAMVLAQHKKTVTKYDAFGKAICRTETILGSFDLGPDHYARLTGVKRILEMFAAGRPPVPDAGKSRGTVSWEELQEVLAARANVQ